MKMIESAQDNRKILKINKSIYSKEVILETAYKFTDIFYIEIDTDENYFKVLFSAQNHNINFDDQIKKFYNELLDQQVRFNLNSSNKAIKEIIINKAFFPFRSDDDK